MKRLIVISALLAVVVFASGAQAVCTQYQCPVGNCPWVQRLIDGGFTNSCGVWSTTGGGSLTSGDICSWTNTAYGQIVNMNLIHGGTIAQTFTTGNETRDLDSFSFQYIIEIDGMTAGDTVKVTVTDTTTGVTLTTDTFTADTWCNSVSHSYSGKGWKGHSLKVKWNATLADTSTTVKITNATFWQEYNPYL